MALDAPRIAFGELDFGQNGQQPGGGPGFGIGPGCDFLPVALEAGQTQSCEHGGQGMDIDGLRCGYAGHTRPSSSASKLDSSVSATGVSSGISLCLGVSRDCIFLASGSFFAV